MYYSLYWYWLITLCGVILHFEMCILLICVFWPFNTNRITRTMTIFMKTKSKEKEKEEKEKEKKNKEKKKNMLIDYESDS